MTSEGTATSKAWFFPTSPRSPYKLKGELELLKEVSHLPWSRSQGQKIFAQLLEDASIYEGGVWNGDPTFSARDRTRGPKILGLVEQVGRGETATLKLTTAGEDFLTLKDDEDTAFFLNQIAKVQFPSAQHNQRGFDQMDCRPLTITLSILLEVGSITKEEFGLFVLTCVKADDVQSCITLIRNFRESLRVATPGLERKQRKDALINERIEAVYADDIAAGRTGLREGGINFVATKRRTLVQDYADSSFRYLLSTGLFRIDPNGGTFSILNSKTEIARELINDLGLNSNFSEFNERTYVKDYLGNTREPKLNQFELAFQEQALSRLLENSSLRTFSLEDMRKIPIGYKRQNYLEQAIKLASGDAIEQRKIEIVDNRVEVIPQIVQTFDEITSRNSGMLDKPLFLEWNTWRAFTALNDALDVLGNFRSDAEGNPLGTAAGNKPDIVVEYERFWLALEVTLMSGHRQFEAESESINRHVGTLQAKLIDEGDLRPVYGLFISPTINPTVLNYLITTANMNSRIYKGPVKIAPLKLETLRALVLRHQDTKETDSGKLLETLQECFQSSLISGGDEPLWFETVESKFNELIMSV